MKNRVNLLLLLQLFLFLPWQVLAVQKATIVGPQVEIYSAADFDSEIISFVKQGEKYLISNKLYDAFYRIKLKNGKIGYIVDYELDIEGKGRVVEKDLDESELNEATKRAQDEINKSEKNTNEDVESDEDYELLYRGPTLQLINFHEDTLGGSQVDDLIAVGYKSYSSYSWSVLGAFKAPKYYAEKTGGSARAIKIWADLGFSNIIGEVTKKSLLRYSATVFTHLSAIQVETPLRKYDLNDITLGVALEAGLLIKVNKNAIDIALKYYFDKSNYAGIGLSFLF